VEPNSSMSSMTLATQLVPGDDHSQSYAGPRVSFLDAEVTQPRPQLSPEQP
jgi:hypothetical protein